MPLSPKSKKRASQKNHAMGTLKALHQMRNLMTNFVLPTTNQNKIDQLFSVLLLNGNIANILRYRGEGWELCPRGLFWSPWVVFPVAQVSGVVSGWSEMPCRYEAFLTGQKRPARLLGGKPSPLELGVVSWSCRAPPK